jgi:2-polyprenyl-6-methoxyphenol hydroxylase-like FAD-dependent oxidoreductase
VSLLAGQGASLALAGGYLLARELDRARGDVPGALKRYATFLQAGVRRKQRAGRSTAGWFLPKSRARLAIRDLMTRMATTHIGGWLMRRQIAGDSLIPPEESPSRAA